MDQVVSEFIAQTIITDLKPNKYKFNVALRELLQERIAVTGSISELYIEPMLPCIRDVDLMLLYADIIAVQSTRQLRHEIKLPPIYNSRVNVVAIVDTKYPAYVTLQRIGELHKQSDSHYYAFVTGGVTHVGNVSQWSVGNPHAVKGSETFPSVKPIAFNRGLPQDCLVTEYCLSWPRQAESWPTRNRKYNWPDTTTIDFIVHEGCDLVPVEHQQFRKTGNQRVQRRLSFSRAETVLLNSWSTVQQIVYHVLRHLFDAENLTNIRDSSGCTVVSRYHVKTLMLWFCELNDCAWWNRYNTVVLSGKVLRRLVRSCMSGYSEGYFVTNHNLFECDVKSVELHEVKDKLWKLTNIEYCTNLLVDKYVKVCAQRCEPEIQRVLHESVNNVSDLQILTSAIIDNRRKSASRDLLERYNVAQGDVVIAITQLVKLENERLTKISKFRDVDEKLFLVALAHVLLVVSRDFIETNLVDCADLVIQSLTFEWNLDGSFHILSLSSANELTVSWKSVVCLLQSVTQRGREIPDIRLILLQHYLNRVKLISKRVSKRCIAGIYLAALNCQAGKFNNSTELIRMLTSYPKCKSVIVEGQLLPSFDNDFDSVVGVLVLYQHVQTRALVRRHHETASLPLCSVFSVEVFVNFIHHRCLLGVDVNKQGSHQRLYRSRQVAKKLIIIGDFLLLFVLNRNISVSTRREVPTIVTDFSNSSNRQLLERCAIELLTMYRQYLSRDISSYCTIATTDIEALYCFRTGSYESCLLLSQQNVHGLWCQTEFLQVTLTHSSTVLLDDVLASVGGLFIVTSMLRIEKNDGMINGFRITQLTVSLYLLLQSRLKMNHATRYLIDGLRVVRSLNDRNCVDESVHDRLLLSFVYRYTWTAIERLMARHASPKHREKIVNFESEEKFTKELPLSSTSLPVSD